jgi:pyruvate dehydrogenase (quinone)
MPRLLQIAMQTFVSRGGVSVLVLPGDVVSAKMTSRELEHRIFPPRPAIRPSLSDLKKLTKLLDDSDRVTLFGGAGCADAHRKVLELAERLKRLLFTGFAARNFWNMTIPTPQE